MADFGDILMDFDAKSKKESNLEKLKQDVKSLKRKRDAMLDREIKIRNDLNSGTVQNAATYRLPLAVLPPQNLSQRQVLPSEAEVQRLKNIARIKQKLQAHALCHGVTSLRGENNETKFIFDPYVGGKPFGPFVLRMRFIRTQAVLRGHNLPHAVPTRSLYTEYFEDVENHSEQLAPFIRSVAKHLRAFLSRKQQCDQLRQRFAEDIREFQAANHCTAISFSLCLKDEDNEEQIIVSIDMIYDRDEERPKPETLKVTFDPPHMSDDDRQAVKEQCMVFYSMRLTEAVIAAF
eukprot:GFUD01067098.1.p1 GENE.GFUD01067098.1~~GFUD01067098.1.p1  ORF type:complete len:291 (-),score=71.71 GFUD01067098.1:193-1065(-)